ncbi:MAG: hypothetical protein A2073_00200 [Deltaproteobacteria bacterium GWC2_42_11]|nr:MAG: hypothetical protein A2073_00200 [Deltaproteobacteria bacterium GWC2_42_11]
MRQADTTERIIDNIGHFRIIQSKKGCRFSEAPFLLADFSLPITEDDTVLDIGTGSGIIPLIIAYRTPARNIVGVEIQEGIARLAIENVRVNSLSERVRILHHDYRALKDIFGKGEFSVILSNPPHIPVNYGRIAPYIERAVSRQEIFGTLRELVHVSGCLLKPKGRIFYIYPVSRLDEVVSAIKDEGLKVRRCKLASLGKRSKLFLIEACKD